MSIQLKQLLDAENFNWWREVQPDNFYHSDEYLKAGLEHYCRSDRSLSEYCTELSVFGAASATVIDRAAEMSNRPENLPTLHVPDSHVSGHPRQVRFSESYHTIGTRLYQTGVMKLFVSPTNNVVAMGFLYLLSLNGEAGHACPFACSAGLIKALGAVGTADQQQRYLCRLIEKDYSKLFQGAQYLTESHGGSDVGANRCRAVRDSALPDRWLISGEKWFCSNATADLAVVTGRPDGAPDGTRGLGLFLVPRLRLDGAPNAIHILRLKDKFGTSSLATAEIILEDAVAESLGPVERGFHNLMTYVINTSRLCNCMFATAAARRAYITASLYTRHRIAFGRPLDQFPLVKSMLAIMKGNSAAMLSATLSLARRLDDLEDSAEFGGSDAWVYRVLLNLTKYRTAVLARETVLASIECLGGNGTVESFSILPRLLRDCIVYETWEGPHNVLVAQIFRDLAKSSAESVLFRELESVLQKAKTQDLSAVADDSLTRLGRLRGEIAVLLRNGGSDPTWEFRLALDRLADLFFISRLCAEIAADPCSPVSSEKIGALNAFWQSSHRLRA